MAKIKNNPLLKGASGMLGDVIVYREVRGKLVMSNRPKKSEAPTEHQLRVKSRFMEAVAYAKSVMADATSKAEYDAALTEKSISSYGLAVTDYLKVPQILGVDHDGYTGAVGTTIRIRAIDDFRVMSVRVELRTASNDLIEQGEAVNDPIQSIFWTYVATQANAALSGTRIVVYVTDRPGNVATQTIEIA